MAKEKFTRTKPHVNVGSVGDATDRAGDLVRDTQLDPMSFGRVGRSADSTLDFSESLIASTGELGDLSSAQEVELDLSQSAVLQQSPSVAPVPEPSTGLMAFVMGIFAWWYVGRKR